ncbi:MAG: hypothetical protein ACI4C4_04390 [Lachnospiraceae bacterium]
MAINVKATTTTATPVPTVLNYNGHPLKPNEVLVPVYEDELFIKENVTNPNSIITISVAGCSFRAVLEAVDKKYEATARAQFNYWQNEELGHYGHRMKDESIEDRQERELPEYGSSPSAADIADEFLLLNDLMNHLIEKAPQLAYAALLKMYGTERAEFEQKMRLQHNGANKALNKAHGIIVSMFKDGIENVSINVNKTKNDDYYRSEAQALLDVIIKLRYEI